MKDQASGTPRANRTARADSDDRSRGTDGRSRRRRPTELDREIERRIASITATLGRDVRAGRSSRRVTQAALGSLVGIHQTWVSDIELGRGGGVPLETWVALGVAIAQPLAITFSRPTDGSQTTDAGHLEMQEALLELAATTGRRAVAELPTRPLDPRHSIDVAVWDRPQRTLIIQEAWNTFGDIGAAIRSTHRKEAEGRDLATVMADDDGPTRVATVWIVRATAANRSLVARYPHLFATTFSGSSSAWARAVVDGAPPPERPGLIWFDPASRRITAWRHR